MTNSNELFSLLFDNLPTASAYSNMVDGKLINCNESWLDLYGFDNKEEVIGKSVLELNLLVIEGQREQIVKMIMDHSVIKNIERPIRTKRGKNICVSTSGLALKFNDVDVLLFVTIDITKRKEVEQALENLNKELELKIIERTAELSKQEWGMRRAQEISHLGNWEVDFLTYQSSWSDEMYKIFGYEKSEVEPTLRNYLSYVHPEDITMVTQIINSSMKTYQDTSFFHRSFHKDKTILHLYTEGRFLFNEKGNVNSVYGITQDITNTKLNEAKLIHQYKSLSDINAMRSHLVRKPIAQILGLINVLDVENFANPKNAEVLAKLKLTASAYDYAIHNISLKTEGIDKMDSEE